MSLFIIGLVSAGFSVGVLNVGDVSGNDTSNITLNDSLGYDFGVEYGPGSSLSGDLNLSLSDEKFSSILSACFNGFCDEIILKDFLDNANVNYDCTTQQCDKVFVSSGTGELSSSFSLMEGQEKLIGLKIVTDEVSSLSNFSININSNVGASCVNPLKIDVLGDGSYEWTAYEEVEGEFCSAINNGYGCYEESKKQTDAFVSSVQYCSKIEIEPSPKIKIGANLQGTGSADFVMNIFNDNFNEFCEFTISASGESGCVVDISTIEKQEFDVCINAKALVDENKYSVGIENDEPCGYSGDEDRDFSIFALPSKYASVQSFTLNTEELQSKIPSLGENIDMEGYIINYLDEVYDTKCSNGCIIPIAFLGASQDLTLSDASLFYSSGGGISFKSDKIFNVAEGDSLISMPYSVLDISKASLSIPKVYGNHSLVLKLNNETIVEDFDINVIEAPVIELTYPQKVPAAIDTIFRIYVSGANITKYIWDFGDNTSIEETTTPELIHKYMDIGTYQLTLTVENSLGTSTKSFSVSVLTPGEYIEDVIAENRFNLDSLKEDINALDPWAKPFFENKIDTTSLEVEINKLQIKHEGAGGSSDVYIEVLNSLEALKIPSSLTSQAFSLQYLIDREQINLDDVASLSGDNYESSNSETYKDGIFEWFRESALATLEEKVYSLNYNGESEKIASYFKVSVSPKKSMNDVYFIVNEVGDDLRIKDTSLQLKPLTGATAVEFSSLSQRDIEFLVSGSYGILEMPAYFATSFSGLSDYTTGAQLDVCNNNDICEQGENSKNCRRDCKPWGLILIWLIILLLIGFIFYILLQEWYKKKYEDHLFKNKDDLFNLINFMDNAEKQKMTKEQIFAKLLSKGWSKEQISYAWKKYKGLRTGMWEIPVLMPFEKLMIKKELEKRRNRNPSSGKIAPISGANSPRQLPLNQRAGIPPRQVFPSKKKVVLKQQSINKPNNLSKNKVKK